MILETINHFFKNSVVSIPIITFIISIATNNPFLIFIVIGLVISGIINLTIKHILKIIFPNKNKAIILYRPNTATSCGASNNDKNYSNEIGFPSGHSQSIWFFITLLILNMPNYGPIPTIFLILVAMAISFSRLGYFTSLGSACHTPLQVLCGSLLGIVLAHFFYLFKFDFIKHINYH